MAQSRLLNGAPLGFSNTMNINYKATRCKSKSTFFKNGLLEATRALLKQSGWTQKWMDSKVIRAVVWQRTDLPPGSNMLRRAAQTCSACKLAGVQIIPLSTLANQILARTFFRSLVLLFACPAVGKFSRASSAGGRRNLQSKFETWIVSVAEDCLSPERTFHG